jgi:hypothetical protein
MILFEIPLSHGWSHARDQTAVGRGGQTTKGARWMSWHREAKKDVVAYDIPREAGKQASIRGSPNRETGLGLLPVTLT